MDQILDSLLQEHLSVFFKDFNSKQNTQFKFSLGSGSKVVLKDLTVNPNWLQTLIPGLPFLISKGTVDYVSIKISITQMKTQPMEVEIGNLFLEVTEPVDIVPYGEEVSSMLRGEEMASGRSLGAVAVKRSNSESSLRSETKEGRGGPFFKREGKKYTTKQKVWHGISWRIRRVQVVVKTLGDSKVEGVPEHLRPPSLEVLLTDLTFASTDELWRACTPERARAFSKDLADRHYLFKQGGGRLSVNVIPSNPWFSPFTVVDAHPVRLRFVNLFEPVWVNPRGEDVALDRDVSYDFFTEEALRVELEGEQLLHLADCFKGLDSAMRRSDIPPNPYAFGTDLEGPRTIVGVRVPEATVRVQLERPGGVAGGGEHGLGLGMWDLTAGFVMGPEDYRFTTQMWLGGVTVSDLADPRIVFVEGPSAHEGQEQTASDIILDCVVIHPLEVDEMGNPIEASPPPRPLFLYKHVGCNPLFSDFRPPDHVVEMEMSAVVNPLRVTVDSHVAWHAAAIQNLVNTTLLVASQEEAVAPALQGGKRAIQPPSFLMLRSNVKVTVLNPCFEVRVPGTGGAECGMRMSVRNVSFVAIGLGAAGGNVENTLEVQGAVQGAALTSNDPRFSMTGGWEGVGGGGLREYALVSVSRVALGASATVQAAAGDNQGGVAASDARLSAGELLVRVHSEQPLALLSGLAEAYGPALSSLKAAPPEASRPPACPATPASPTLPAPLQALSANVERLGITVAHCEHGSVPDPQSDACISLEISRAEASLEVLGADVLRAALAVPSVSLSSRATPIVSSAARAVGVPLVSLEARREGIESLRESRDRGGACEAPWEAANVAVTGVRVQIRNGDVGDVLRFTEDLVGIRAVGEDVGEIVLSLYQVARLNTKGEEAEAARSQGKIKRAVDAAMTIGAKGASPVRAISDRVRAFEGEAPGQGNSPIREGEAMPSGEWSRRVSEFALHVLKVVPTQLSLCLEDWQVGIGSIEEQSPSLAAQVRFASLRCTREQVHVTRGLDGLALSLEGLVLDDGTDEGSGGGHSKLEPFSLAVRLEWEHLSRAEDFSPTLHVLGDRLELVLLSPIILALLSVLLEYRAVQASQGADRGAARVSGDGAAKDIEGRLSAAEEGDNGAREREERLAARERQLEEGARARAARDLQEAAADAERSRARERGYDMDTLVLLQRAHADNVSALLAEVKDILSSDAGGSRESIGMAQLLLEDALEEGNQGARAARGLIACRGLGECAE